MQKKILCLQNRNISLIVLFIISLLFLFYFYHDILVSPNHYLFSQNGDGVKAYYAAAYYIKDVSFFNLNGMNYPYGESIVYPDAQPGISIVIKVFASIFPEINNYTIGIFNFLMIISFVFTALFLWLILNRYVANYWFNVICAFGIVVLSPQIFRIPGHITMAYSCFFPISWYILIRYRESVKKVKWSIISISNSLFWFFVHPYLGLIITFFYLGYYFFDLIFNYREPKKLIKTLYLFACGVLPAIIFNFYVFLTDTHVGRPLNPYGFLIYISDFTAVFLPIQGVIYNFLHKHILFDQLQYWEGWAYIGLISIISIGIYLTIIMYYFGKYGQIRLNNRFLPNKEIKYLVLCSICILLFSMGYPFRWNLTFLADKFTIIKQFRSAGRFAWVFYYVICVSSVYFLFNLFIYFKNQKRNFFAYFIFILPLLYTCEGIKYHQDISKQINQSVNLFNRNQLDNSFKEVLNNVDFSKYQSIIPLPMFCIGSDKFTAYGTDKIMRLSFVFSYHSSLPILGKTYARTSLIESKKIMQIISPSFYPKLIKNDITSNKDFIILYSKELLSEYEKSLLDKGVVLYENSEFGLFSITKEKLFENNAHFEIEKFKKIKDSLIFRNGFFVKDTNSFFYFNDFENNTNLNSFQGNGCLIGNLKDYNCLAQFDYNVLSQEKDYDISFWMYNWDNYFGEDVLNSVVIIEEKNNENKLEWIVVKSPGTSFVINDKWSLIELKFKPLNPNRRISILLVGSGNSKKQFYIDNLMIRENNSLVYKILNEKNNEIKEISKNNQIIKNN